MRFLILVAGAAMAASYMVTWIEPPFAAQEFSPVGLIGEDLQRLVSEGPWQAWVFLGGFAVAGLAAILAFIGRPSGFLALLAGASPVALGVHYYLRAEDLQTNLGLPFSVDFSDLGQAYELLADFIRAGLWMYLGGAGVLLLVGMSMVFGKR